MLPKEKLEKLYASGLSMSEIAQQKKLSYDTVKYWMKKYNIPRRSNRESSYNAYWGRQEAYPESGLLTIKQIKTLYFDRGLSVPSIAKKLGRSDRVLYKFMERNGLFRRSASETNAIIFSKKPFSYQPKDNLTLSEEKLKTTGIMLYWAEGSKADLLYNGKKRGQTIDFANSDSNMIKIFLKFLRNICGINEQKLRIYLYCHANQNVEHLKRYWSEVTKVPIKQFTKPYVRQDFNENKKDKMKYGLIHVRYCDTKLFLQIMRWIRECIEAEISLPM